MLARKNCVSLKPKSGSLRIAIIALHSVCNFYICDYSFVMSKWYVVYKHILIIKTNEMH